ncbi:glycoprotein-N-acetylgalactosamine 3-beta-galactosyltransferase 1-like, partial [Artemia franciscana]|uniref:glycoprotein-N-acetylgalactosamine 3-beta-galactosyltransferase 1-like n=1 Tax=Artemia franciscana TaxID=6661 RepID=UPI0032DB4A6F
MGIIMGSLLLLVLYYALLNSWAAAIFTSNQTTANTTFPINSVTANSATVKSNPATNKILIWVMTSPKNHQKALHVKNTWGNRTDKLLFFSTEIDENLPTVKLPVQEGYAFLWNKTREAFKFVYEKYLQDYDWFMKSDDDTFVNVENLRYMLSNYSPSKPTYFGCKYKLPGSGQVFMSGGGGYILSQEALRLFVEEGYNNKEKCSQNPRGFEDVEMGRCLENVGVKAGDSRDEFGRERFSAFPPEGEFDPAYFRKDFWAMNYSYYPRIYGQSHLSDNAISFHYVTPANMYALDYLMY